MSAHNAPTGNGETERQSAEYVRTVGSLFSGIGGIDLGLERAGFRVIWQAEMDSYASKVLAKHWPEVPNLSDVTKVDWSEVECPDVVAGGFPCQPVSMAGRGLAQLDERWLWPEFERCVRQLRPDHVVVENVPGLLVRGMGDVLGDLAALGYDTEWTGIPAVAVGAPHLRWRVFIVAHPQGVCDPEQPEGTHPEALVGAGARTGRGVEHGDPAEGVRVVGRAASGGPEDVEDTPNGGSERRRPRPRAPEGWGPFRVLAGSGPGDRGFWAVEPDVGRVAHGIPRRVDRLRCLGNAVVPQVAEYVGRQLAAHIDGIVSAEGPHISATEKP